MALEDLTGTGAFIAALNPAWPVDDDWVDEGDDHIRGIKNVLKNTLPGWNGAHALFPDGTVAAPGIAYGNDPATGWSRDAATGAMVCSIQGSPKMHIMAGSTVLPNWGNGGGLSIRHSNDTPFRALVATGANHLEVGEATWGAMRFYAAGGHRGEFGTSGMFKALSQGTALAQVWNHEMTSHVGSQTCVFNNTDVASPSGIQMVYTAMGSGGRGQSKNHIEAKDTTGVVFVVWSNGGVYNYSANNVNISDASVKVGVRGSPDYTALVEGLKFKRFSYEDQPGTGEVDGVLAQDIGWLDGELVTNVEGKLGVYEQRLQQRINSVIPRLIERIKVLESKLGRMESALARY